VQLYHDASNTTTAGAAYATISPLAGLAQGTANGNRIGSSIGAKWVDVKLWLSNKADRPNVMYRVAAVIVPAPSSTTPPVASTIFLNGGTGNYILQFPDTENYTIVYDKVLNKDAVGSLAEYPSAAVTKERSWYHDFRIPINSTISYGAGSGSSTVTASLWVYVIAYDAYGSLASDNIASYAYATRLVYTDT
jgi:hypothetical protein